MKKPLKFDIEVFYDYIKNGKVAELKEEEKKGNLKAFVNRPFSDGKSPLNLSITHSSTIMQILIKAGADVNHIDENGDLPIVLAATMNTFIIEPLLKVGADINKGNIIGTTAFIMTFITKKGTSEGNAVHLFKAKGFDIHKQGVSPQQILQYSIDAKRDRLTLLILKSGYKFNYDTLRNIGVGTKKIFKKFIGLKKIGKYADLL